ncbi:MAG: spore coat protein CotJB [Oscillospiraceae bacterium]|nr:spore coat protein CotJB [Oscillospiraceae bacterium]
MDEDKTCNFKKGTLPECAPLATAYVPMQENNAPMYSSSEALTRGTLFPGLDLPFLNKANSTNPYAGTPLGELMALDFIIKELNLYLDTHPDDKDAFAFMKKMLALSSEGRKRYVKLYGPISMSDMENMASYTWLSGPWPWEYHVKGGDC